MHNNNLNFSVKDSIDKALFESFEKKSLEPSLFISLEDKQTERWKDISLITFIFLCTIKYTQMIFKVATVINGEKNVQACHETGPNTRMCVCVCVCVCVWERERKKERQWEDGALRTDVMYQLGWGCSGTQGKRRRHKQHFPPVTPSEGTARG